MQWMAEGAQGSQNPGRVIKNLNAVVTNVKLVVSTPNTGAGVTNQASVLCLQL
jgi:hypothetical protein